MASVEQTIEVNLPVRTVYNQWTQFEEFPQFMEGVEEVRQLDETRLHWRATIAGKTEEWDAVITDQVPDQRIAWRAIDGKTNVGEVTFRAADGGKTEVTVQMDWEPEGLKEKLGGALGFDDRQLASDLERFEHVLDERGGRETGAWRGEQH